MKTHLLTSALLLMLASTGLYAQQCALFTTVEGQPPYRIPAITTAKNGDVIAINDWRPCGSDIGYGEVDLMMRRSTDNGKSWSDAVTIADGTGEKGSVHCGFGDAALVTDRKSGRMLLMCVCGNTPYWSGKRDNPNRVARFRSEDGGKTWSAPEEATEGIYSLFDNSQLGPVQSLFFGSGRIMQSRKVKVGKYYRLYAALCATPNGNRVIYSDDFGETWHALGSIDISPAPKGDEPKCEELPDGSVILSSRKRNGRWFNVFRYSNVKRGEGTWGEAVETNRVEGGISVGNNACNGEIMLLNVRKADTGKRCKILLQSIPTGDDRRDVTIFYKEINPKEQYTPTTLAEHWTRGLQVSHQLSAYSTMTLQQDGHIGFYYEEGPTNYNMVYRNLTVSEITNNNYK